MNRETCNELGCRRWATHYTTSTGGTYEITPLWYACRKHATPNHQPIPESEQPPVCGRCGSTEDVSWVGGGTAYHYVPTTWDILLFGPGGLDPNRDSPYCRGCGDEYREYWDEMWKE